MVVTLVPRITVRWGVGEYGELERIGHVNPSLQFQSSSFDSVDEAEAFVRSRIDEFVQEVSDNVSKDMSDEENREEVWEIVLGEDRDEYTLSKMKEVIDSYTFGKVFIGGNISDEADELADDLRDYYLHKIHHVLKM